DDPPGGVSLGRGRPGPADGGRLILEVRRAEPDDIDGGEDIVRTLITGGGGFIGPPPCGRFPGEGPDGLAVDKLITPPPANIPHLSETPRFQLVRHDISQPLTIEGPLDNILHFASPASPVDYLNYPIQTLKVGSLGTHITLGLAKAKNARYLMASTSEVYGDP